LKTLAKSLMKKTSPHHPVPQGDTSVAAQLLSSNRSGFLRTVSCLLLCSLFSLVGCEDKGETGNAVSLEEMREKLNHLLPKGTKIQMAKDLMLKEGFSCEPRVNAKWKGKAHLDYLHCTREDGSPPVKLLWEIAVFHDETGVLAVDPRRALVYP
jgi:hypothetical protein